VNNKYPSRYSPSKFVEAHQFIIELICEKNAAIHNRDLPIKFWQLPEWSSFFRSQLRRCQQLLKKYDADSIIKALKDKRTKKTYSLYGSWLEKVIAEYYNKTEAPKIIQDSPDISGSKFERKDFKQKKNLLDKLNELN